MNVLVVGATGGSGLAAVDALLAAGHAVTALARNGRLPDGNAARAAVRVLAGDVMQPADLARAVAGQDAVIVTVGIRENPLRVRLRGPAHTPMQVRSAGTAQVMDAMQRAGVRRLVVQTSYGVGDSRDRLPLAARLLFALLLKPQIADTELQEAAVRRSPLDWTCVQPVNLDDGDSTRAPFLSTQGEVRRMQVTRRQVGQVLADALGRPDWVRRVVAVSGA